MQFLRILRSARRRWRPPARSPRVRAPTITTRSCTARATSARRSTPIRCLDRPRRRQGARLLPRRSLDRSRACARSSSRGRPAAPARVGEQREIAARRRAVHALLPGRGEGRTALASDFTVRVDYEEPVERLHARRQPEQLAGCRRRCSRFATCASSSRRGAARWSRSTTSRSHRARRDPRRGRRVGRRQVAHRRGDHRPARSARAHRRRRDPLRRPAHRQPAVRGDAQGPRPRDRRDLPGPADLAQSALHDRPAADRDDPDAPAGRRRRGAPARHPAAAGNRHPGRRGAPRPVPAPVLRRHAPARRHRARARRRAAS